MKLRNTTGNASYDRTAIKRRLLVETLCDRRVLAALHGVVIDDVDQSWRMEVGETALAQRLVFIDENNSGLPDDGERFALTDAEGGFTFDELGGDEQIVRLLARTTSQQQHFPFAIDSLVENPVIDLTEIDQFESASGLQLFAGQTAVLRSDTGLIHVDLDAIGSNDINLKARPTGGAMLPDGRLLVLANDTNGNFAFTILGETVEPIDLLKTSTGASDVLEPFAGWSSVSVDASGNGVLVPVATEDSDVELRQLAVGEEITSASTSVFVAAGTSTIGGGTSTTVIAEPTEGGLELRLWSNSTATMISPEAVTIPGAESILGYSDDSGLVFAWVPGGGDQSPTILVLDADANFATLQTIVDLDDVVAVDLQRSVIFSLSTSTPVLRAIDAITSEIIARWDLVPGQANFAEPSEIAIAPGGNELVILVATGIAKISLTTIDAHRVRTDGSTATYPLRFAVEVDGENSPPRYQSVPRLVATQGTPLILAEGTLKQGAVDDDEDLFVVVRSSAAANGTVRITPGGAVTYTANPGFVGTDSFQVFLHDGRGASEMATIEVDVLPPVIENPEVIVDVNPVPENAPQGFAVATIQTIGMGGRPLTLTVDDPRFVVVNNMILVGPNATLDYEESPFIIANLTASDSTTGEELTATVFTVTLSDENDPITDLQPRSASVQENAPGETIAELTIEDQDADEDYTITVFDERFEIVGRTLKLKDGVSLDYEVQREVVLNIVAADTRGGTAYATEFVVTVIDVEEPIESISLTNASVIEYVRSSIVGSVMIDGQAADENYLVSVDDSRFEVVDGVLRLREGVYLVRADQEEAIVVVTAQDTAMQFPSKSETFLIEVLENANPFHNPQSPYDVNSDDEVTPLDALLILNALSQNGSAGPISDFPAPGRYWDVNGDGMITPLDALLILNYLNVQNRPRPTSEPEGDSGSDVQPNDSLGSDGSGDMIGPQSPRDKSGDEAGDGSGDAFLAGPQDGSGTERSGSSDRGSRLRLALPDDLSSLIPDRFRNFDFGGLISDGKLDLDGLRDRLIAILRPSDWDLLQRLESAIRRTPIDKATIEAIDRALMAINAGWEADELA